MRHWLTLVLLATVAPAAAAQEDSLPPGIVLLSRVKQRIGREMDHLPEYTCLETVQRFTKSARPKAELEPLDTLRLEILYTGKKELYSSPGGREFRDEHPASFTSGGMIGDGIFASHLHSIFLGGETLFTFRGQEQVGRDRGWANAAKFDFRISSRFSQYHVTVPDGSGIVGIKGSFWADPETHELLRMEIHADDIPPTLPIRDIVTVLNYSRMRIGERDIMLPQSAELRLSQSSGNESLDLFEFTHCRSYHAQSSITFGAPDAAPDDPGKPAARLVGSGEISGAIPAGLTVQIGLTTLVDNDAAVGTLIEGRVRGNVEWKGKTLLPDGALVRGRIRRLEQYADAGKYFMVGLEFTEVEADGTLLRFYADLQNATGAPGLEWSITGSTRPSGPGSVVERIRPMDLPGVGSFIIRGDKLSLPQGFQMVWRTRALKP